MGNEWDAPWKSDRRQTFDGTLKDVRDNAFGRSKIRYGNGPSYGSNEMQMQAFQRWLTPIFLELHRVLKPGGHLLSFGGPRTCHRMACAIEDAGFQMRDQIAWVYGSGFPKSRNGEWGGTALKPAHEPIAMARKSVIGTVSANWKAHGTGALNIEHCRVKAECEPGGNADTQHEGRWPANLIHDGSDEVLDVFPNAPGQLANESLSTRSEKTSNVYGKMKRAGEKSRYSENSGDVGFKMKPGLRRLDSGSAARFFYCAKASKSDRAEWNNHPTVKPSDLMRYLVRLVTPAGGIVLDPFMGSGSTGKAAMLENFRFIGIDRDLNYCNIAKRRIDLAIESATL